MHTPLQTPLRGDHCLEGMLQADVLVGLQTSAAAIVQSMLEIVRLWASIHNVALEAAAWSKAVHAERQAADSESDGYVHLKDGLLALLAGIRQPTVFLWGALGCNACRCCSVHQR